MERKMGKWLLNEIEKMAATGIKQAREVMIEYYIFRMYNVPKSKLSLVINYLYELADENDTEAMVNIGSMYYGGIKVKQNYKEAFKWYKKAADLQDANGLCFLGYCYYYGRDMEVDREKAFSCFYESASLGHANGMFKLGDMYYFGYHVPIDKDKAFYWYEKANNVSTLKYDKASSKYRLGKSYLYAEGVAQDIGIAIKLLSASERLFIDLRDHGDDFAEFTLKLVKKELKIAKSLIKNEYSKPTSEV